MARVLEPEPGMEIYDPCCGSGGLLVKCESALEQRMKELSEGGPPGPPHTSGRTGRSALQIPPYAPLQLYGQEYVAETWAMANMNMIIHDMQGQIEIGDTFKNPKFRERGRLKTFDRVVANPMWNQDWFTEADYANDELDRFPTGAGFPGKASAVVVGAYPASNAGGRLSLQVLAITPPGCRTSHANHSTCSFCPSGEMITETQPRVYYMKRI